MNEVKKNDKDVSISEKYLLSIKEAGTYFNIGTKKMRRLAEDVYPHLGLEYAADELKKIEALELVRKDRKQAGHTAGAVIIQIGLIFCCLPYISTYPVSFVNDNYSFEDVLIIIQKTVCFTLSLKSRKCVKVNFMYAPENTVFNIRVGTF